MKPTNQIAFSFFEHLISTYRLHHQVKDAQEVHDNSISFELYGNDFSLPSVCPVQDRFFNSLGFILAPLASADNPNFRLRTYRHLSGSEVQVMASYDGFLGFFIEQRETPSEKNLRLQINELKSK